jgi:hypothetical protein
MTQYELAKHMNVPVIINREERTQALLDSGAMGNFIHPRYVQERSLITMKRVPLTVNDVNCDVMR